MRLKQKVCWLSCWWLLLVSSMVCAGTGEQLQTERINAIKQYVHLLGKGDYHTIPSLFTDHAVAVSANGESDSIGRFYEAMFKKSLSSPDSTLINIFDGRIKENMMTAYYNLSYITANGELETNKFVDLFIFQADSAKIKTIFVFKNSFKQDQFKLKG